MSKNKIESTSTDLASVIATSGARIGALRALERTLCARQVELEQGKAQVVPPEPCVDLDAYVAALAEGKPPLTVISQTDGSELYRVRVQREAIPKAIALIDEQLQSAARKRAELNLERRGNEIRELQRQTVLAICALQRLNRDRDRVVREVREGVPLEILGDFLAIKIGGYGHGGDAPGFRAYLDLMVQIGVVTRGEIEKARGDTKELH